MTALQGHDPRHVPATEQARTDQCAQEPTATWVMQSEAAASTGFSLSAIRKWRRMGLVADRRVRTGTGLERVEVKLEDVVARATQQADRRRADPGGDQALAPAGTVSIALEDLETLFERMVTAERRAEEAEAVAEALRAQATFTFGQLAELRRQLQEASPEQPAAPPGPRPVDTSSPRPAAVVEPVRRDPVSPGERPAATPARSRVDELGERLRRIYARLDEYRREPVLSPDAQRRHQRELAEYDRVLVALCDVIGIETGLRPGQPVGPEDRAALTRALARAGLDVRAAVRADGGRKHRVAVKRRL